MRGLGGADAAAARQAPRREREQDRSRSEEGSDE